MSKEHKKLSASKIAKALTVDIRRHKRYPIDIGGNLHEHLGYNNNLHFSKEWDDYLIQGTPDKYNGKVIELKTFWYPDDKTYELRKGEIQLQVYGYICGGKKPLELHLYDVRNRQFDEVVTMDFEKETFDWLMEKYCSLI